MKKISKKTWIVTISIVVPALVLIMVGSILIYKYEMNKNLGYAKGPVRIEVVDKINHLNVDDHLTYSHPGDYKSLGALIESDLEPDGFATGDGRFGFTSFSGLGSMVISYTTKDGKLIEPPSKQDYFAFENPKDNDSGFSKGVDFISLKEYIDFKFEMK